MFLVFRPDDEFINRVVTEQRDCGFTYDDVGATRSYSVPPGFSSNRRRYILGQGLSTYERACDALRAWQMVSLGWLEPVSAVSPPREGAIIATLARSMMLYTLNVGRVIYAEETAANAPARSCTVGYGTLPEYPLRGEERFTVELDPESEQVTFEVFSFSSPDGWLARLGAFHIRRLQQRFCEDSAARMRDAVK